MNLCLATLTKAELVFRLPQALAGVLVVRLLMCSGRVPGPAHHTSALSRQGSTIVTLLHDTYLLVAVNIQICTRGITQALHKHSGSVLVLSARP